MPLPSPSSFSSPWLSQLNSRISFSCEKHSFFSSIFGHCLDLSFPHRRSQYSNQGSAIRIDVTKWNSDGTAVGISPVDELEQWAANNEFIEDFGWISYHLRDMSSQQRTFVGYGNLGHYIVDRSNIYGVSPNIFDVMEQGYFEETLWDSSSPYSIGEQVILVLDLFLALFNENPHRICLLACLLF